MSRLVLSSVQESGAVGVFSADCGLVNEVSPSPNHGVRRDFAQPDCLILHYTGMPTAEAAIALLSNPSAEVSCHYVIEETGRIVQLVPEARRAWHAGVSCWGGERDMNSASIGVEICNPGHDGGSPDFAKAQIEATIRLCRDVADRWRILPHRVLAHSDIAPGRKRDPGEKFPWGTLAHNGVGHWVEPTPIAESAAMSRGQEGSRVRALQTLFALYGYDLETNGTFDARTEAVVTAFQRHFRPAKVDGEADESTVDTLRRLLRALPGIPRC